MSVLVISNLVSMLLAAAFVGLGAVHISGPRFLRSAYQRWGYGSGLHRALGTLQFTSAVFLALPQTRIWGGLLAGTITFVAVVTLLHHRKYVCAVPGVLILGALPVAMASGMLP